MESLRVNNDIFVPSIKFVVCLLYSSNAPMQRPVASRHISAWFDFKKRLEFLFFQMEKKATLARSKVAILRFGVWTLYV